MPNIMIFQLIKCIRKSAIEPKLIEQIEPVSDQHYPIIVGDQLRDHQVDRVSHCREYNRLVGGRRIVEFIYQLIHSSSESCRDNQMLRFENFAALSMNDGV